MTHDEQYMRLALEQAHRAAKRGEVPVGAVLVDEQGRVIALGRNRREKRQDALAHAEIDAIVRGCRHTGSWRLEGCTLYVTLEPCAMCAGAIVNSRVARVVYGASDPKAGAAGSVLDLFSYPLGRKTLLTKGVMQDECAALLTNFFRTLRKH
ncbi:MAG: tRNA adenosine(34) deaminase TadA [Oscillospiraceae bacterium]|nr:tRNA adenosine(34) deaminase TadA [Oscillospiraceae bacterium]